MTKQGIILAGFSFAHELTEKQALTIVRVTGILSLLALAVCVFRMRLTQKRMENSKNRTKNSSHSKPSIFKRFSPFLLCALPLILGLCIWSVNRTNRIPQELLDMKVRYPETADFVDHYPENKDKTWTIDLSTEVHPGSIPLFLQWDERWGYESYGNTFLALTGCGPTFISMITCGLLGESTWNPYEVAKFSEQQGYYVPGEGTAWNLMTEGAQLLGLNASYGDISADFIYNNLSPGHPMICSMWPGDFTTSGHFIVLTAIDNDGNVIVNDPNSKRNSDKHWTMDVLLPQIRSLWIYGL